ncbi:MAG: hypothetical protein RLZZ347_345 [Candidatus Parcubacteria bacterium]
MMPTSGPVRTTVSFFTVIALVLFFVALSGSLGVFFYERYLTQNIATADSDLVRAQGAFDPTVIKTMIRLDARLTSAKALLGSHLALSPLFDILGKSTLKKSVRFKTLDVTVAPDKISLSMKGQATGFTAIALQSDSFGKDKRLKSPLLSDLSLDLSGAVSFTFTASVDPAILAYKTVQSSRTTSQ